jgi:hypothetical protein
MAYEKRNAAYKAWRRANHHRIEQRERAAGLDHDYDALSALVREAFNAGWAARKEAQYEAAGFEVPPSTEPWSGWLG